MILFFLLVDWYINWHGSLIKILDIFHFDHCAHCDVICCFINRSEAFPFYKYWGVHVFVLLQPNDSIHFWDRQNSKIVFLSRKELVEIIDQCCYICFGSSWVLVHGWHHTYFLQHGMNTIMKQVQGALFPWSHIFLFSFLYACPGHSFKSLLQIHFHRRHVVRVGGENRFYRRSYSPLHPTALGPAVKYFTTRKMP